MMEDEKSYNFGSVVVGMKKTFTVEITNNSTIQQSYKIEQQSRSYQQCNSGFLMSPDVSPQVYPGKSYKFKLTFSPTFPESNYCDYFTIYHLYGVQMKICALGYGKGIGCRLSHKTLTLTCPPSNKKIAKFIEFHNPSSSNVVFLFDLDVNQCPLIVEPLFGDVPPCSSIRLKVTYYPSFQGVYFKRLFCLCMYQNPLVLDVTCIYGNHSAHVDNISQFLNDLPCYEDNYDLYMSDVSKVLQKDQKPLASLNITYLNLGSDMPTMCNTKTFPFTLTNNSGVELSFNWSEDSSEVFKIKPKCSTVQPYDTNTFHITFHPHSPELLYSTVFDCMLKLKEVMCYVVAFPLSISLFGHSFTNDSAGWPAIFDVFPNTNVFLPPCSAQNPVYTTILIKRNGCLPLAFRFHHPVVTNYEVKPIQGVITGNIQIIIVRFLPKIIEEGLFKEKWTLKFNTNKQKHKHTLYFMGSVEKLKLIINEGKPVVFPTTNPGCQATLLVPIMNPTRHTIKYRLDVFKDHDILDVEQYGEVFPNQSVLNLWSFMPVGEGNICTQLKCFITSPCHLLMKDTLVTVKAESKYAELQAQPDFLEVDTIKGVYVERSFQLVNTGLTITHVHLCCNNYTKALLQPTSFTLEPGESVKVTVSVTADEIGVTSFQIMCELRIHSESDILVDNSSKCIVDVSIEGKYPLLQVIDLCSVYQGPNFSKLSLWKMLNIDKLNNCLSNISSDVLQTIPMKCPSFPLNHSIKVEFLLKNDSGTPLQWNISQNKSCDCKAVLTQISFSISKMVNFCQHKDQIVFKPCSGNLEAQEEKVVTLTVYYSLAICPPLQFTLSFLPIGYDLIHSVHVCIFRQTLSNEEELIDCFYPECSNFRFSMVPIPVDSIEPYVQAFWLYNNTSKSINFRVDYSEFKGSSVFGYINHYDYVEAQSTRPLLFTFHPNAVETYSATVMITYNGKTIPLLLTGNGLHDGKAFVTHEETKMPSVGNLLSRKHRSIYSSTSHIKMNNLKTHGQQRYIFILNNISNHLYHYKWIKINIEDVLFLKVIPSKGYIPPQSRAVFQLICYSLGTPCCVTVNIFCILKDITANNSLIQENVLQQERMKECQEWFTITEKGTTYPDCASFNISTSFQNPEPVVISVFVICSPSNNGGHCLLTKSAIDLKPSIVVKACTVTDVLSRLIWNVLNEMMENGFFNIPFVTYYSQLVLTEKESNKPELKNSVLVPKKVVQSVIGDIIFSKIVSLFELIPRNYSVLLPFFSEEKTTCINKLQPRGKFSYSVESCGQYSEYSASKTDEIRARELNFGDTDISINSFVPVLFG